MGSAETCGAEGTSYWLFLRPQVNLSLSRGPEWEPWASPRGVDLRGRASGRRRVGPTLGRPLVSLERVGSSQNRGLVEALETWGP